ncbi:uncharacterized protein LOC131009997 [Salvia miltiorrhiza]|uniref:uncharacterized protein LOC131009997 n=1 Tax=Salvia miltiorrhiza TaxID=226208 RepID=UPI0025AC4C1E|nr:uncharacterized protein LOC131009997 [Salvia miltiorrhiza]
MSDASEDFKFSLKVMIDKKKNKVIFAESDSNFVDILLSFLTLPLGRIIKILDKHYGDEAAAIGSLSSLYRSAADLACSHFWTEGAKKALLNPTSSFEDEIKGLKLDFADSPPAEYFRCSKCPLTLSGKGADKRCKIASGGVFTKLKASFIISDDLRILPNDKAYSTTIDFLGITDADKAEAIEVDFGFSEIMKLLKASLTSPTPLSDVVLNQTTQTDYAAMASQQLLATEENPNCRFLYAQATNDFVEFLFSFLNIPLGGVEHLFHRSTHVKSIDKLYLSTSYLIEDEHFKSSDTKNRLIKPNVVYDCIPKNHILPLTQAPSPNFSWLCTHKFPNGHGSYVEGPRTYHVKDDLTVSPFCFVSVLSSLVEQNVPVRDVEELEVHIGLKEACGLLKASLTSTAAITDALLNFGDGVNK